MIKIWSSNTAKNVTHFTNFPATMFLVDARKKIGTARFLDTQELHSPCTQKANVCIFLYISVRKYFLNNLSQKIVDKLRNYVKFFFLWDVSLFFSKFAFRVVGWVLTIISKHFTDFCPNFCCLATSETTCSFIFMW